MCVCDVRKWKKKKRFHHTYECVLTILIYCHSTLTVDTHDLIPFLLRVEVKSTTIRDGKGSCSPLSEMIALLQKCTSIQDLSLGKRKRLDQNVRYTVNDDVSFDIRSIRVDTNNMYRFLHFIIQCLFKYRYRRRVVVRILRKHHVSPGLSRYDLGFFREKCSERSGRLKFFLLSLKKESSFQNSSRHCIFLTTFRLDLDWEFGCVGDEMRI